MLMFSASEIAKFKHLNKHKRYGQDFYDHFKLHKITGSNKAFCDKLYNANDEIAKAMIASRTDKNN